MEACVEAADGYRQLLERPLTVNASLVGRRQNEEMRRLSETSLAQGEEVEKVSSWAALLLTPSLLGATYGVNFDVMPERHRTYGCPYATGLMPVASVVLHTAFTTRGWLQPYEHDMG